MSTQARSLRPDAVVAVSEASRAVGELAGLLSGLADGAVWAGWLRRSTAGDDGLDVAVRCAAEEMALLDAVPLRPSTALTERLGAVADAARWAAGAVRSADGLHREHVAQAERERLGRYAAPLLRLLAEQGELTIPFVVEQLCASPTTVGLLMDRLAGLGLVEETTGRRRGRRFRYAPIDRCFRSKRRQRPTIPSKNGAMAGRSKSLADWADVAARRLFEAADVKRVVVFGSVARGEEGPDSDLDLLVVLDHVTNSHDDAVRMMKELRDVPIAIDVLVTDDERLAKQAKWPGIIRVALREGRVIERAA